MTTFEIHKGVDAPVEFKGLRSQYLFICAGGLIGAFLIVVVLYMCGVGQFLCLGVGGALAAGVVMLTYRLNEKYGTPPHHQPSPCEAPNPFEPCIAR